MTEAQGPMHEQTGDRTRKGLNHFGLPYENPVTTPAEHRTDADPASIRTAIGAESGQPETGIGVAASWKQTPVYLEVPTEIVGGPGVTEPDTPLTDELGDGPILHTPYWWEKNFRE